MPADKFWAWFNQERRKRGLSIRAVERLGGVGTATIGGRERQNLPPTFDICRAISRAFGIPLEDVLRKAELLPPTPDEDPRLKELVHWFLQLDEASQEVFLASIRALAEEQARREQEASKHRGTGETMDQTRR